jgi:radical SAM superfamily enzyme YgiQ (UPF0313 family)
MRHRKNVLMVYPRISTDTFWSYKYTILFARKKANMPPLGLLTIAAMLPETYTVKLIDMNVERLDEKAVEMADIVFLSAMIVQKDSFAKVVKLCNELKTPVVAGGPYPTSLYQEIEGVDYFVLNEAEITLKAFIKDYENGTARKIYTNDKKPELTETPVPMFDLIDTSNYMMMTLQHSRGCPFNCEFCDITEMYGRKTRTKPIPQFLSEIEAVYNTGFTGIIFIVDDNFIGNKKNIKQLLRSII